MNKIYYLGYYDQDINADENRNFFRAATTKMDYIISKIVSCGLNVCVLSMSGTKLTHNVPGHLKKISNNISLELLPSLGRGSIIKRIIEKIFLEYKMYRRLCLLTKNDILIAYHSLGYAKILKMAKKKLISSLF